MLALVSKIAFLVLIAVVVPLLAAVSRKNLREMAGVPRVALYVEALLMQFVLAATAIVTAWLNRIALFRMPGLSGSDIVVSAVFLAGALVVMLLDLRYGEREPNDPIYKITPESGTERIAWLGISAVAAASEEITYRGALVAILLGMTGNLWVSIAISSIVFGLAHLVQGWQRSGVVAVFGFAFHLLVIFTGSLYPAIAVHFVYDVIAGYAITAERRRRERIVDATG